MEYEKVLLLALLLWASPARAQAQGTSSTTRTPSPEVTTSRAPELNIGGLGGAAILLGGGLLILGDTIRK